MAIRVKLERLAVLAGAGTVVAVSAGSANAQSCTYGVGVTQCRLMLSQPRRFAIEADATRTGGRKPAPSTLALDIDGKPCRVSGPTRLQSFRAVCTLELTAAEHVATARLTSQDPAAELVTLTVSPSSRLAALPREDKDLYPKGSHPGLKRFWPF